MAQSSRISLLLGPETGQKQEFIDQIKKSLTKEFNEAPEVHKHYAFETPLSDVLSLARNGDLFCSHKLIILSNVEEYKKADFDLFKDFLKEKSVPSTLIFTSEETKCDGFSKQLAKDQVKVFWEMSEGQLKGWVLHHFQTLGVSLTPEALDFFLEMVDKNTDQIRIEAQKILAFFEMGAKITLEDLETFLVHSKEENVFTLFENIMIGTFPKALEVLKKIIDSKETEGIALLAGLVWQFKTLLNFQIKLLERYSSDQAFQELNIRSRSAQDHYLKGSRRYSLKEVQNILALTCEFDFRIRQYKTEHQELLLELYLYYLMMKKGNIPETPVF